MCSTAQDHREETWTAGGVLPATGCDPLTRHDLAYVPIGIQRVGRPTSMAPGGKSQSGREIPEGRVSLVSLRTVRPVDRNKGLPVCRGQCNLLLPSFDQSAVNRAFKPCDPLPEIPASTSPWSSSPLS